MATQINNTTMAPTVQAGQRRIDRCQNGVMWAGGTSGPWPRIVLSYSTDDGATWSVSQDVAFENSTSLYYVRSFSFFIDVDDYIHLVWANNGTPNGGASADSTNYLLGTPNASRTAWTWGSRIFIAGNSSYKSGNPDVVAHRNGTGWAAHIVSDYVGSSVTYGQERTILYDSNHVPSIQSSNTYQSNLANLQHDYFYPSIDFKHTGDGKTAVGQYPDLYVAWSRGSSTNGLAFMVLSYNGPKWQVGSQVIIGSGEYVPNDQEYGLSCVFDGTAVAIGGTFWDGSTQVESMYERDAANTTTTLLWSLNSVDRIYASTLAYDGDRNLYLLGENNSGYVSYAVYNRALDSRTLNVVGSLNSVKYYSAKRGYSNNSIDFIYHEPNSNPKLTYDSISLNSAPLAPTWNTTSSPYNKDEPLPLDWAFNDPDGDASTAYALQKAVNGGSVGWWSGSAWGGTETKIVTTATSLTLAAGWASVNDSVVFKVKGYDAFDLVSPLSAGLTITAVQKVNPVVYSPTADEVITVGSVTPAWTCASQSKYTLRLLSGADVELYTSGQVTSTSARQRTINYALVNNTTYKVELTTVSLSGITSDTQTVTFSTSFTTPQAPTLTATGDSPVASAVTITIAQGTASATPVAFNDVYRREAATGGAGIRVAADVAPNGTLVFYTQRAGTAYQYKVISIGDNQTVAASAWT
jgi:hypothetical protein